MKPRICVVGSANMDLTVRTSRLPRPGETLPGLGFAFGFGGKGANQAVMAARLGAAVTMIARVGNDAFGKEIVANFRAQEIDSTHVFVDEVLPTGLATILVDDRAENTIIVSAGANRGLSPDDIERAQSALAADVVVAQLEIPEFTVLGAFRRARAAGAKTILNPAPAQSLPDDLLRLTDICVPNEGELSMIAGHASSASRDMAAACRKLLERGVATVVVTLGPDGALLVEVDRQEYFPAPEVKAVDTTGAGDAFIGALAAFVGQGQPVREAVVAANKVAALSVTRAGAQASFPSREELERWSS